MKPPKKSEFLLWILFQQLLRRGVPLGMSEYGALRDALWAGFGWESTADLRELCVALWAKSQAEAVTVRSLFDGLFDEKEDWRLPTATTTREETGAGISPQNIEIETAGEESIVIEDEKIARPPHPLELTSNFGRLPPLTRDQLPEVPRGHVFLPQFPVDFRTVAQTWRRLRVPVREGPRTELDVDATVERRAHLGIASPPVLQPRRRNRARLLLLVDRQGSMAPFHQYVDQVCAAIRQAAQIPHVTTLFFHDTPLEGADSDLLTSLAGELFPPLDAILNEIEPLENGFFYSDEELLLPQDGKEALDTYARNSAVLVISDGGAARSNYDLLRLLDTIAFFKALKKMGSHYVWLNPLPPERWQHSSAEEIARHLPMFPMDRHGMHRAVNVLRGQPHAVESPL